MLNIGKVVTPVCFGVFVIVFFLLSGTYIHAQTPTSYPSLQNQIKIEQMVGVPIKNDFSIGPTKFSYDLVPGEEVTAIIQITSRLVNMLLEFGILIQINKISHLLK